MLEFEHGLRVLILPLRLGTALCCEVQVLLSSWVATGMPRLLCISCARCCRLSQFLDVRR